MGFKGQITGSICLLATYDGQIALRKRKVDEEKLEEVIRESNKRQMVPLHLRVDRVTKDGPWKSTTESTIISPVLYFTGPGQPGHYCITQRPSIDKMFGL